MSLPAARDELSRAVITGRAGRGRRGRPQCVGPNASRRRQSCARGPRNVAAGGAARRPAMTLEIEIAGRRRRVSLEPLEGADQSGGRFRVLLDDVACIVDARRTDLGWSIVYEEDRRSVDAAVTEQARGDVLVQFPHADLRVASTGGDFVATRWTPVTRRTRRGSWRRCRAVSCACWSNLARTSSRARAL